MDAKKIAREIAENSIVLLKNEENLLPLAGGKTVAFFGRGHIEMALSGNGSGAANIENPADFLTVCRENGLKPVEASERFYRETLAKLKAEQPAFDFNQLKHMVNSGLMYEFFGKYTPPAEELAVSPEMIRQSAEETDTAVLVLGRSSGGEECDRHVEDDYYLSAAEQELIEHVCAAFPKVAVVLNVNGLIDLTWIEQYPSIKSLLFLGIPGEQGPAALANILSGKVNPSGKLPVTIARAYEDYPTHGDFSWDKDHPENIRTYEDYGLDAAENGSAGFAKSPVTVYKESIYLGYRYFDSFGKKPLYPFGYGLSYTQFAIEPVNVTKGNGKLTVEANVKNIGNCPGKEAVQLYISAVGTAGEHPYQELKGFGKTSLLAPGASETVTISVSLSELAVYCESSAAYVIEQGTYLLRLGNSSVQTEVVGQIKAEENIVTRQLKNRLDLQDCNVGKIDFLTSGPNPAESTDKNSLVLTEADIEVYQPEEPNVPAVAWEQFSVEELAALCVGYGPGVPFAALQEVAEPDTIFDGEGNPLTTNSHPTGYNGYVSPAIEEKGVRSVFYKDGPAGVGGVAWPSEMLYACSFDADLCRKMGDAVGGECEERQIDVWLAPAVNLHRHPLGGRNFEYLSEDPFLSGTLAAAIAKGAQENHPVLVCAKHFAVNEQETYRRGSTKLNYDAVDSILPERAARELYLKPFEMLVKDANLRCIMSSFNKINGTFAGGSHDLCTYILREEWGFDGVVVTDWGDMDMVVDGADAVAAGNDVIMPGGPPVIAQILAGYKEGRVTLEEMRTAVSHLFSFLQRRGRYGK